MSDVTNLSVAEIAALVSSKKAKATEVADAFLAKAEKAAGLGCFIDLSADAVRKEAIIAQGKVDRGEAAPLLGVPVGIKDNILTKGLKATCGSKILSNFVAPYDATVVTRLRTNGAVNFGRLNMDEFAMGSSNENSAYGPVRNPWNTKLVPGGSSGGSAAAVAASVLPAALGSDTGGSIRQPAAYCGIVGIKPTYGRVSRYGLVAYASSLDQIGALARTAKDAALILESMSGKDPYDATSVDIPVPRFSLELSKSLKGLRIGIPQEYFLDGMDPEVVAAVQAGFKVLESRGAKLVSISLPHTKLALDTYYIIAPAEASSNLARFDGVRYGHRAAQPEDLYDLYAKSRAEGFGGEVKRRIIIGSYVLSSGYYDAYYLRAQRVRALIAKDFTSAFQSQCDVVACPTAPTAAFELGAKTSDPLTMYLNDIFTIPVNLAGLPGLSMPCGLTKSNLPIGMQLIGKPWDEGTLLAVAHQYDEDAGWTKKRPPSVG